MSKVFTNLTVQKLDVLKHAIHLMTSAVQAGHGTGQITQLNAAFDALSDVLLHPVPKEELIPVVPTVVKPIPAPTSAPAPQPKKK